MLITINDASKIFGVHENSVASKIRVSGLQPVNTQAKAKLTNNGEYTDCKVKLFDFYEMEKLLGK